MAAAAKRGGKRLQGAQLRGNCKQSRGKCATNTREAKRKQEGVVKSERICSCAIAEDAATEVIVRRRRIDFAEALREKGLDEFKLAGICNRVVNKAKRNCEEISELKFLMDCVEKIARVLESKRANDRAGDRSGAQVLVQLVHQVARPERGMETLAAAP